MKQLAALSALALLLYPLLFYLLLDRLGLPAAGVLLGVLVLTRLASQRRVSWGWRAAAAALLCAFVVVVWLSDSEALLKLYPVAVNGALLGYGLYTLWRPPSAIERLMRTLRVPVSAAGQAYMRGVTAVWCVFFAANGVVAAYTAIATPVATWAIYNGALSYVAAGLLMGVEYLFRGYYRRRLQRRADGMV